MKNFAFLIVTALVFLGCGDPPAPGGNETEKPAGGKDNKTEAEPAGGKDNKTEAEPAGNKTAEPAGNETGKPESGSTDGAKEAPTGAPDGGNCV